jgi:type VI secretion system secreted protein VgrG
MRGPKDEKSSIPVRVVQPQAAGAFVLPRVGWEAFAMFEDGDPERPVVLGRSYNAKQVPPLPLPANKTVTLIGTDSSPGAAARTAIQMDDAAGREHILLSAPFGRDDKVFGDARVETRKNENAEVKADATHTIGGDETVSVHLAWLAAHGSRSISVAAMQKQTAGGSFITELGGAESVTVGGVLGERVGNPVKGAANLVFSAALAGIGSRGTAGAIVAAGLGIGRAAVEGYEKGGAKGAEHAAEMGLAGIAASMVPGGDAIMASVTGSAKPMPWDQGRPPEGVAAEGGGATAPSGASGAQGPGPGHRSTVIDGSYTEMVAGSYSILTPGAVSWVTVGPATLLVNGNHTTQAVKAGLQVAGAMNETAATLAIESATSVARKIKGVVTSDVAGARAMQAGGEYRMTAKGALKLSVGGSLGISGGTITFKCGASELVASSGGVSIHSVKIRITGSSSHSGKLTHE